MFSSFSATITDSLGSLSSYTPDILQIVVKVLRVILLENVHEWLHTTPAVKELLAAVLDTYLRGKFPKEIRTKILIMLSDIVLDHKLYAVYGSNIFNNWLPTLPKLLCLPFVSSHVLKTFSHLARQKNPIFLQHLEANQDAILGTINDLLPVSAKINMFRISANLPQIQISGLENQAYGKQDIINLFYWLDAWTPNQSDLTKKQLEHEWPMIEKLLQIRQRWWESAMIIF